MKKWMFFLAGLLTGFVFTYIALSYDSNEIALNEDEMKYFEQPADCISQNQFKVMQVLDDNHALALEQIALGDLFVPTDLLVLFTNNKGEFYYDNQMIEIPKGKCVRQIGIYKYLTTSETLKTVPIVMLMDK